MQLKVNCEEKRVRTTLVLVSMVAWDDADAAQ